MSRPSRAELVYVAVCLGLFVIDSADGGDHVWPYLALAIILLPPGMLAVVVLALGADGLPTAVAAGFVALAVVGAATYNIVLVRMLRASCCRRRSRAAAA